MPNEGQAVDLLPTRILRILLKRDTSRNSQGASIQLLVNVYKRRTKRFELSIDQPFPEVLPEPVKMPKNIARQALDVKAYLALNPNHSYRMAAEHYNVTKARISQLIKIVDHLPASFIKKLDETDDPALLRRFSGKQLLRLASFETKERMEKTIESLMSSSCE